MNPIGSVNATLLDLIRGEPIDQFCLLDVGCGSGALTFALASYSRFIIGIDIIKDRIEEAKRYAASSNIKNVSFYVKDADTTDYRSLGEIDMVVSHLCMSDEIIIKSYQALNNGGLFIIFFFTCILQTD